MAGIAFLVLGAENTGTRLVTRLLMAAGAIGDDGHKQRLDDSIPVGAGMLVWRRSFPHGPEWPDVKELAGRLRLSGYEVQPVVTMRDWHAAMRAQVQNNHADDLEEAEAHLQRAYKLIFNGLMKACEEYHVVSYEALVQRPERAVRALYADLGLEPPDCWEEIYDGNEKYYD